MSNNPFDPFGEPMAQGLRSAFAQTGQQGSGSRLLLRSGTSLFWTLVFVIVAARVTYFDPDFAEKFRSVAALSKRFLTVFT